MNADIRNNKIKDLSSGNDSPLPTEEVIEKRPPYCITVCSGKGGVGKSIIVSNIGYMLSQKGFKVLIWDSDLNFPNIHLLYGVEPPVRSNDIIENDIPIEKALYHINDNLCLLTGRAEQNSHNGVEDDGILAIYEQLLLRTDFDYILIDTPAGASEIVLKCCNIADLTMMVVTDEPASLVDAYVLVKLLLPYLDSKFIKLVINNCIDDEDAENIIEKINLVTGKFLETNFETIGMIPYDRVVRQSILRQKLFMHPDIDISETDLSEAMFMLEKNLIRMSERMNNA